MRARNELNALLYRQKMGELKIPEHLIQYAKYTSIQSGDVDAVRAELADSSLTLMLNERILSHDQLRNATYHFVLAASTIAVCCIDKGLGQTEAYTLSDLYTNKADHCRTIDDMRALFADMCLDYAERMQEIRKEAVISLHIRKCIDYIYENLSSDLSVKSLAVVVGLNSTYLSRLFRQETGIPLTHFVKEARVDTAQNLLRYSDLTYPVISTSLGFSTQSVFIAVFKEITGMTPKEYRTNYYSLKK